MAQDHLSKVRGPWQRGIARHGSFPLSLAIVDVDGQAPEALERP